MSIEAVLFRSDGSDDSVELEGRDEIRIAKEELLWVDASSLDSAELATIRRALGLTDRAVAALKERPKGPDATVLEGALEVVVRVLADGADGEPTSVQILVGDEWIITHHARPVPFLEEQRDAIRDDRPVGRLTPVQFLVVAARLARRFVLQGGRGARDRGGQDGRRRPADRERHPRPARGHAAPHCAGATHPEPAPRILRRAARPVFLPDLDPAERDALAGLANRLERASEAITNTREMLIGTFDVHMTRTAQRTNDIMRVLTLASVVLLPSVVLAGVMGMNFKVWIFDNPNLFWVVVGIMAAMAAATLGVARWRGWL